MFSVHCSSHDMSYSSRIPVGQGSPESRTVTNRLIYIFLQPSKPYARPHHPIQRTVVLPYNIHIPICTEYKWSALWRIRLLFQWRLACISSDMFTQSTSYLQPYGRDPYASLVHIQRPPLTPWSHLLNWRCVETMVMHLAVEWINRCSCLLYNACKGWGRLKWREIWNALTGFLYLFDHCLASQASSLASSLSGISCLIFFAIRRSWWRSRVSLTASPH